MSEPEERRCVAELLCPGPYHAAALVVWLQVKRPDLELVERHANRDGRDGVVVAGSVAGLARLAVEQRAVNEAVDRQIAAGQQGSLPVPLAEHRRECALRRDLTYKDARCTCGAEEKREDDR